MSWTSFPPEPSIAVDTRGRPPMVQPLDPVTQHHSEGILDRDRPEVLFVCVHNAGRSQMAAGLLERRSDGRIHVRSAGSTPAEEINPAVVTAMEELGVD